MKRFRPSIAGLMALVLFAAIAFAALRGASAIWASVMFTLTLVLLSTAILGAFYCQRPARIAWAGFAVFGWAYLAMTFGPWPNKNGVTVPPFPTMLAYEPLWRAKTPPQVIGGGLPAVSILNDEPHAEPLSDQDRVDGYLYYAGQAPEQMKVVAVGPPVPERNRASFEETAAAMQGRALGVRKGDEYYGTDSLPPPGMVFVQPDVLNYMQLRRILHAIGAIAFALIGAIIGRIFAAWIDPARSPVAD